MMQDDITQPLDDMPPEPQIFSVMPTPGAPPLPPMGVPPVVPTQPISRATRFWGRFLGCLGVFMLITVILGGIGGAIAFDLYRQPPATSDTTQSFTVGSAPHLVVHSTAGNLHFVTGTGNSVTVETVKTVRALTHEAAQKLLNDMHTSVTQSGNTLTVDDRSNDDWQIFSRQQVDFTITLPAQSAIDASLSAGNMDVTGVTGQMNIDESAGNVQLHDVTFTGTSQVHESAGNVDITGQLTTGTSLDLENSAGNITFNGSLATNNRLNVRESAGNVTLVLPQATSAHINAHVSAGGLSINGWPININHGTAEASAGGNTLSTDSNPTNNITVENSAGNISISTS